MRFWLNLISTFVSILLFFTLFPYLSGNVGKTILFHHLNSTQQEIDEAAISAGCGQLKINIHHASAPKDLRVTDTFNGPEGNALQTTTYRAFSPSLFASTWYQKIGFNFRHDASVSPDLLEVSHTSIAIPVLLPLLLSTILPVRSYFALLRATKRPRIACPKCHYDLRGSLSHSTDKCPECGTPFNKDKILKRNQLPAIISGVDLNQLPDADKIPPFRLTEIVEENVKHIRDQNKPSNTVIAVTIIALLTFIFVLDSMGFSNWIIYGSVFLFAFVYIFFQSRKLNQALKSKLLPLVQADIAAEIVKNPPPPSSSITPPEQNLATTDPLPPA